MQRRRRLLTESCQVDVVSRVHRVNTTRFQIKIVPARHRANRHRVNTAPCQYDFVPIQHRTKMMRVKTTPCQDDTVSTRCRATFQYDTVSSRGRLESKRCRVNTTSNQHGAVPERQCVKKTSCQHDTVSRRHRVKKSFFTPGQNTVVPTR